MLTPPRRDAAARTDATMIRNGIWVSDGNGEPSPGGGGGSPGVFPFRSRKPSTAELARLKPAPIRGGEAVLSESEVHRLRAGVPRWMVKAANGVKTLEREFLFRDFRLALGFADRVGEWAEAEGHHPQLVVAWGKCRVTWWTHRIGGLHRNDFIMAAGTDLVFRDYSEEIAPH